MAFDDCYPKPCSVPGYNVLLMPIINGSVLLLRLFLHRFSTSELEQLDSDATGSRWRRPVKNGALTGLRPNDTTITVSGVHPWRTQPDSIWRNHSEPSSETHPASSFCRCRTVSGSAASRLLPGGNTCSSASASLEHPRRTHTESSWRSRSGSKCRIQFEPGCRIHSGPS